MSFCKELREASINQILETQHDNNYFNLTYKQKFKTYIPNTKFKPDQVHLLDNMYMIFLTRIISHVNRLLDVNNVQ